MKPVDVGSLIFLAIFLIQASPSLGCSNHPPKGGDASNNSLRASGSRGSSSLGFSSLSGRGTDPGSYSNVYSGGASQTQNVLSDQGQFFNGVGQPSSGAWSSAIE